MNNFSRHSYTVFLFFCSLIGLNSCSISKKISNQANLGILKDSIISHAHTGICIYEPATGKYWYQHDADKFFVPASNTKLFSLYTGLKYIGDSLPGMRVYETSNSITIEGMGDPTFLHPDYRVQPVFEYLSKTNKPIYLKDSWKENAWGRGWGWDDYADDYMSERSQLPLYGNVLRFSGRANNGNYFSDSLLSLSLTGNDFINSVSRQRYSNKFSIMANGKTPRSFEVPFISSVAFSAKLLSDTLHKSISLLPAPTSTETSFIIYSQPVDSLFRLMMHRSDNFFAEQTLLMASNKKLGRMSDDAIISDLLKSDLKDIPQQPQWVDGSGLSRYNLFSPQDFVFILNKLKNDFGWERITKILPTGGTGTLKAYYLADAGYIFAKTGTLSNHVALSGYLITKKNKLLIFSVLVNHYNSGATPVRKAVEKFLKGIREQY
jgi:D-alanyl-D-alanine carboxypeptidase/D-alanyl-D-alanine-endopeptidase (penicillin-binding protein 4)